MIQVFSINGINYYEYGDILDIIKEEGEPENVFIATKVLKEHNDFLSVSCVIEEMQDRASDLGEFAEGYLDNLSKNQKEDLHNVVLKWFNSNIRQPDFFLINNPSKISLKEFYNYKNLLIEDITKFIKMRYPSKEIIYDPEFSPIMLNNSLTLKYKNFRILTGYKDNEKEIYWNESNQASKVFLKKQIEINQLKLDEFSKNAMIFN